MEEELTAPLLIKLSQLNSTEIIHLGFQKEHINRILTQALENNNLSIFSAALKIKYYFAKHHENWFLNIPKIIIALLYLLSEPFFKEEHYLGFESLFLRMFVQWCNEQKLARSRQGSDKGTLIIAIKKIIYVLENNIKSSSSQQNLLQTKLQVKLIVSFYLLLFGNHMSQELEAKLAEHLTFIFKNKKAIPLLKLFYNMEFALLDAQQRSKAIINRVECASNNPKLSLCIEIVCLLLRVGLKNKHLFSQNQIQYLQRLFEGTVSQQILTRANLKDNVHYFLYHMTHEHFIQPLKKFFSLSPDYQIIFKWKKELQSAVNRDKSGKPYTFAELMFYFSLLPPTNSFPAIQSNILPQFCTHPFIQSFLNKQPQISIKLQTQFAGKENFKQVEFVDSIFIQIKLQCKEKISKILLEMNILQKSIFIFYFYKSLTQTTKTIAKQKQLNLQAQKKKIFEALQLFSLKDLINLLEFLIFDLKIAKNKSISSIIVLFSDLYQISYSHLIAFLTPCFENLKKNITQFHTLRYYNHIIFDSLIQTTSFRRQETLKIKYCRECFIACFDLFCSLCQKECVSFCFGPSKLESVLQDTSSEYETKQTVFEDKILEALSILPHGFTHSLLKRCLFPRDNFCVKPVQSVQRDTNRIFNTIPLEEYANRLDALLK